MVVLTNRYNAICSDESRIEQSLCIADALIDLMRRRNYFEVVETLEIAGVLSREETLHFLGLEHWQQLTLEEAARPLPTGSVVYAPLANKVFRIKHPK